jgi:hypothetical protein
MTAVTVARTVPRLAMSNIRDGVEEGGSKRRADSVCRSPRLLQSCNMLDDRVIGMILEDLHHTVVGGVRSIVSAILRLVAFD